MIDTIINGFDIWTDSQGLKSKGRVKSIDNISLEGIASLRKLILDLAIQGLLVSQDPAEEPAKKLLTKNTEEKNKLIKEGVIRKQKPLSKISEDYIMKKLPVGWEIEYLQEISWLITKGSTPTSYGYQYTESGIRFVKVENIEKSRITTNGKSQFIDLATHNFLERSKLMEGDILFSIAGTIGRTGIVRKEDLPANTNQALAIIRGISVVFNPEFMLIQLDSFVSNKIKERARGGAMNNISLGDLNELILYIPPLNEQKRIVAKVDELMSLCDKLEEQQFNNLKTHQLLVKTLLETLTQAVDTNELQAAWERMSTHFDTLFCTENSIDQLKQTILQLAVMGKLVKQDPNDEPANELLKKIANVKEILVEKGEINNAIPLPKIINEDFPFNIPKSWVWCRFGTITDIIAGLSFKSGDFNTNGGTKCIKITNAGVGEFIETNDYLPESFSEKYSNYLINGGDLILALTRPYISDGLKISICPHSYQNSLLNQRVAAIRLFTPSLYYKYVFTFLQSPHVLNFYKSKFENKSQQPNMKMSDITYLVFALPPLHEQKRIVHKVNELFALCESVKEKVLKSQELKVILSKTIIEKAVS